MVLVCPSPNMSQYQQIGTGQCRWIFHCTAWNWGAKAATGLLPLHVVYCFGMGQNATVCNNIHHTISSHSNPVFYILTCQACSQASDNVSAETFQARTKTRLDKFGQSHDECRYLSSGAWVLQHRIQESAISSLQTKYSFENFAKPPMRHVPH